MDFSHVKGVLFDLDGTLVDSLADLAAATNQALWELGLPQHPLPPFRQFVGNGARKLVERAMPETHQDPERIDLCLERMRAAYAVGWANATAPYPGIEAMLGILRNSAFRIGILSNKPDPFTQEVVAHFFPDMPFDPIRGAFPDVPLKPDPAASAFIEAAWSCKAAEILYVGDGSPDVRFAKNAGMPCIGVAWGFRGREELEREGADLVVETTQEILEALGITSSL